MAFDYSTLITDRASSDSGALRALVKKPMSSWTEAEAAAFKNAVLKGSYDYTDLNRVCACVEDLVSRLRGMGYAVSGYQSLSAFSRTDAPTRAEMEQYRQNVAAVRAVLTMPADTASVPDSLRKMDTDTANRIESILLAVEDAIQNLLLNRLPCGAAVCGGEFI